MADEKDEKFDEKEHEKQEEKTPGEKSWEEKYRRDPLGGVIWAAILIWAGLVLLANNMGLLDRMPFAKLEAWGLVLIGAGVIVLIEVAVRLTRPEYRRPVGGSLFFAIILIGAGLGNIFGLDVIWPLIVIALGASILIGGFLRRK